MTDKQLKNPVICSDGEVALFKQGFFFCLFLAHLHASHCSLLHLQTFVKFVKRSEQPCTCKYWQSFSFDPLSRRLTHSFVGKEVEF